MKLRISERVLTDAVARTSPWLAPLPTAYLTFERTVEHLRWPWPIGLAAGLVVEGVGLSAINTALEFREHNRGLRDGDKRVAPFILATAVAGVYFLSVIGLTVILDTMPQAAQFAPLVFPALSGCGALIIAMRKEHGRRVEQMILSSAPPYNKKVHKLRKAELLAEMAGADTAQPAEAPAQDAVQAIEDAQATEDAAQDAQPGAYRVCELCAFTAHSPQAWAGHCRGAEHKRRAAAQCVGGSNEKERTE